MTRRYHGDIVLGIDPGLVACGIAVFQFQDRVPRSALPMSIVPGAIMGLRHTSVTRAKKTGPSGQRIINAMDLCARCAIDSVLGLCTQSKGQVVYVVIESPIQFGSSATSHAASVRGDLTSVALVAGGVGALVRQHLKNAYCDVEFVFVHPQEWKGQLSKPATISRIQYRAKVHKVEGVQDSNLCDHAADAVGMCLWAAGLFS